MAAHYLPIFDAMHYWPCYPNECLRPVSRARTMLWNFCKVENNVYCFVTFRGKGLWNRPNSRTHIEMHHTMITFYGYMGVCAGPSCAHCDAVGFELARTTNHWNIAQKNVCLQHNIRSLSWVGNIAVDTSNKHVTQSTFKYSWMYMSFTHPQHKVKHRVCLCVCIRLSIGCLWF